MIMKNILLITLMLILVNPYYVIAKDHKGRPPPDRHHRPHDKNKHDNN